MEQMYVFLDIDGVLNGQQDWKRKIPLNKHCIDQFARYIHELNRKYKVKIILSSTWREGFSITGKHSEQIARLLEMLAQHDITIDGKTEESFGLDRAEEINSYIHQHGLESIPCVILDDTEEIFMSPLTGNALLHLTNPRTGFTKRDRRMLLGNSFGWKALWNRFWNWLRKY